MPKIKTGHMYFYEKLNFKVGLFSCIFLFEAIFIFGPFFPLYKRVNMKCQKTAEDDHKSKYAKKQTHFKIQFYIRIHVTKVKKSFCFIQRALLATAQNSCFG